MIEESKYYSGYVFLCECGCQKWRLEIRDAEGDIVDGANEFDTEAEAQAEAEASLKRLEGRSQDARS